MFKSWIDERLQDVTISVWKVETFKAGKWILCDLSTGWIKHPITLRFLTPGKWVPQSHLHQIPYDLIRRVEDFWIHEAPLDVKAGDSFTFRAEVEKSLAIDPGWVDPKSGKVYGRVYLHMAHASIGRMMSLSPKGVVGLGKLKVQPRGAKDVTDERQALADLKAHIKIHLKDIQAFWAKDLESLPTA